MRVLHFLILVLSLIFFSLTRANAQPEKSDYKLSVSGFVRADAIFDSRQVVEAREGFLLFYPKKPLYDINGEDINARPTFNQYAMTTRLTARATGPDVLGARVMALIESDFTGASNSENNSLRLRHAYISLQWTKTRLLIGQYWHPIDLPEMIPNVLSLNTGAPFHAFSRQPQIRLDRKAGKFNLVLAASSQRDYVNNGPKENSSIYIRNSVVPNLHGQVQYKNEKLFAGLAADYKMLTPRISTDSLYVADESLNCLSWSGFINYNTGNFSIKGQYTYGQALNDHLMMGGFGVSFTDSLTNQREYSPLNYHFAWLNAALTFGKWQPSMFLGFTKNCGSTEKIKGPVYARDADIDYVYRIAPMITYVNGKFSLIAEVEYTAAAYGRNDANFRVTGSEETGNIRIGLGVVYGF
ncbi:MAG: outer membrane protein [Bacteroidetes bacterium]|nr:MAG: outer membrane protein [Bacteroidota bacterium]